MNLSGINASFDRRKLLAAMAGAGVLSVADALHPTRVAAQAPFTSDPFTLGIASGDPSADGFVIWTRLAPAPLQPDGGMPAESREVTYEIAADEAFTRIVRSGKAMAQAAFAHAVHVEIGGLEAGREYFYRFIAGGVRSPVGRAITFPKPGAEKPLRFASAGCQWYEEGLFTAWRRLAEERLDFVFHYGDYIYEYAAAKPTRSRNVPIIRDMPGNPGKCRTLGEYRQRYAIYKLDADLQAAHASCPFIVSFDDHEIENNWAAARSERGRLATAEFLLQRTAAFQAWYEHMPLRRAQIPKGPDILAHRRLSVGNLLQLDILDTRQYRSPQPCDDGWKACPEARDAARTLLGAAQEKWLAEGFAKADPRWNVLAQQVPMARFARKRGESIETDMDKWDGAEAARDRLFNALKTTKRRGVVALAGDVHQNRASNLTPHADGSKADVLGVEFVATSISSAGDGRDQPAGLDAIRAQNPDLEFINNRRGYIRHTVDANLWRADYRVMDKVSARDGVISTGASYVTERASPGLKRA